MTRLTKSGHGVDLQILDNEFSAAYKLHIEEKWGAKFQLVPPDVHLCNIAKRVIRTFKVHFLAILAGISDSFPNYMWDRLLPQTELTLNLLFQSNILLSMLAWENYNGPFNFDSTPIGPIGCPFIIYNKPLTRKSWQFHGRKGFNIGLALNHYCCFRVADTVTKALLFSDTVEFMRDYFSQPTVSERDRIIHALKFLSCALKDSPATIFREKITAITKL